MASKELSNPIIKHFENSSIAAGDSFDGEWDSDDNYIIRHILITADGAAPTQSTITIRVDGKPITKDKALCKSFGVNAENALLFNIPLGKDRKFEYEGTNNEGATKTFVIDLVMEKT